VRPHVELGDPNKDFLKKASQISHRTKRSLGNAEGGAGCSARTAMLGLAPELRWGPV
jgi:hypothetical protein